MQLSINGAHAAAITSSEELDSGLMKWGAADGDFIILADGDADYIQSAIDDQGYVVEIRDGATAKMYRAVRTLPQPGQRRDRWSREEALSLVRAYFPLRVRSGEAGWEDMHMRTTSKGAQFDWYRLMSSMRMVRTIMVLVIVVLGVFFALVKR